jgi:hypothetical protein
VLTWGTIQGTEKVYLGTDPAALELAGEGTEGSYTVAGIVPGRQYFWRVDVTTAEGQVTGDLWTFTLAENTPGAPAPSDGAAFVAVDGLSLAWLPAFGATAYDVYFGADPENLELLEQVAETSYADADRQLLSGTVHHWRVDAIKDGQVVTGSLWSFETMPIFPVEEALAAWYKFELGEGSVAVDWTRKGNDGTLVGDTQWVDGGFAGSALLFDGAADYVEIPRVVQDDWTISLWLRTDNHAQSWPGRLGTVGRVRNGVGLIDGDAGGPAENFALSLNGQQIVAGCTGNGQGGDGGALRTDASIVDTDWHHVAWTRDAATGEMALLIDGVPNSSGQSDKWIGTKDSQDFIWIGGLQFANRQNYFEGNLDEVKFFTRVLNEAEVRDEMRPDKRQPYAPAPAVGSVLDQELPVALAWTAGDGATAHNVYLGIVAEDLPLAATVQDASAYDAGLLEPGIWYWQIGEVQPDGAEVLGDLWSFIVADYLIIDDFESYTNEVGMRLFETWVDGLGYTEPAPGHPGNGTGGVVGHDIWSLESPHYNKTIVETDDVHSGSQAMPSGYNNAAAPWYSEAVRTWTGPQDFTRRGVDTLTLFFRGYPIPFEETSPGSFTMSAAGADIWGTADEFRFVAKRLNGDCTIIARVDSVEDTHAWAKAGVMIRSDLEPGATNAAVLVTPGNGVSFHRRLFANDVSTQTVRSDIAAPHWVKLTRTGDTFAAQHSADGASWVDFVDEDGTAVAVNVPMVGSVYVGLCLTSHNVDAVTVAEFAEVSTAGAVSGAWEAVDIGVTQPGNSRETVYVGVQDAAGGTAVTMHPNPDAALLDEWTQWDVPLSDLSSAGVDLQRVTQMFIGAGDRDNPQPDGAGALLVDDLRLTTLAQ